MAHVYTVLHTTLHHPLQVHAFPAGPCAHCAFFGTNSLVLVGVKYALLCYSGPLRPGTDAVTEIPSDSSPAGEKKRSWFTQRRLPPLIVKPEVVVKGGLGRPCIIRNRG